MKSGDRAKDMKIKDDGTLSQKRTCLMHAKLYLLRYEGFLRVMISSGNQIATEWRDSVEVSWICDFQKRFASGSAGNVLGGARAGAGSAAGAGAGAGGGGGGGGGGGAAAAAHQKQPCSAFAADLSEFVALCLSHPEYLLRPIALNMSFRPRNLSLILGPFMTYLLAGSRYEREKHEWCTAITSEFDVSVADGVSLVPTPGKICVIQIFQSPLSGVLL